MQVDLTLTFGFSIQLAPEAISLHDGFVVLLMGFTEFRWHGNLIVQIYKDAVFDTNRKSLLRHISAEKGLK